MAAMAWRRHENGIMAAWRGENNVAYQQAQRIIAAYGVALAAYGNIKALHGMAAKSMAS